MLGLYRMNCDYPWIATTERSGLACARPRWEDASVDAVAAARRDATDVVIMVHWGTELHPCPERWQRVLARRWVRAGASLIVGSHPHVLQGIERIDGAWVLYSTGNFVFAMAGRETAHTAFFEATFDDDGIALRARPACIVDGVPHPATGWDARRILAMLSRRSSGLRFDDDGVARDAPDTDACPWPAVE